MQCFCNERAEAGDPSNLGYGSNYQPVCQEYLDTYLWNYLASNSVTVLITVINILIREKTIDWITQIGYETHSEQVTAITNGVFFAQFFNTAILVLFVYANFEEFGIYSFEGPFYDYSPQWYSVVGYKIVQTMVIYLFLPIGLELMPMLLSWISQRRD